MKYNFLEVFFILFCLLTGTVFAQEQTIVITDPARAEKPAQAGQTEENLIKSQVLPRARRLWAENDLCEEDFQIAGVARGSFSRAGANQTLIFYQFCQTGNGFGNNGLVLIENGKITGSYISEGGWAQGLKSLPDINQNGLNEFLVFYSGGMHQGESGTGVDIMEFSAGQVKGLGWFQFESYSEARGNHSFKVSVRPGKAPVFYRERYVSTSADRWRRSGKIAQFKLDKAYGKFTVLK